MTPTRGRSTYHFLAGLVVLALVLPAWGQATQVVSSADPLHLSDTPGGDTRVRGQGAFSADGRFLAFDSDAANLTEPAPGPPTRRGQVYVLDRQTGLRHLISHLPGQPAAPSAGSRGALISADGRFVAFQGSPDLVPGIVTVGYATHVYLHDRQEDTTVLVSHAAGLPTHQAGRAGVLEGLSADGRFVLFGSSASDVVGGQVDSNSTDDVFLYDRLSGESVLVSHTPLQPARAGNGYSGSPLLSADGDWVAFESRATDLVGGADTNGGTDIFLYERPRARTRLVSHTSTFAAANQRSSLRGLSSNGQRVLFTSRATDLVAAVDANDQADAFLYERLTAGLSLVSHAHGQPGVAAAGATGEAVLSADGSSVALLSSASDLVPGFVPGANGPNSNLYLQRLATADRRLMSRRYGTTATGADDTCTEPAINATGDVVLAVCTATDLVRNQVDAPNSADVFLFRELDKWGRLLTQRHGQPGWSASVQDSLLEGAALSPDGSLAAFSTDAAGLTAAYDANTFVDLFLWSPSGTELLSRAPAEHRSATAGGWLGSRTPADSFEPPARLRSRVSADGRFVVFESVAPNLVPGQVDTNAVLDIFLHDRALQSTRLVSHAAGSPSVSGNSGSDRAVISADGSLIVFVSFATNLVAGVTNPAPWTVHVYAYDVASGGLELLSRAADDPLRCGNNDSADPHVSSDGRYVAFFSTASDLVTGFVDANGSWVGDVFLLDRASATLKLLSHRWDDPLTTGNDGSDRPEVSANGAVVVFESYSSDLLPGVVDTNGRSDLFSHTVATGARKLESHAAGNPTQAADLDSAVPVLSADGRYLAFLSLASNLMPGQTEPEYAYDAFLRDRSTGLVTLVSHKAGLPATTAGLAWGSLNVSADGRFVAFESAAPDLVAGQVDGPESLDVFLFDRSSDLLTLVSHVAGAPTTAAGGERSRLSADGRRVLFTSYSHQIVAGQVDIDPDSVLFGATLDLFAYDRAGGTTTLLTHRLGFPLVTGAGSARDSECSANGSVVYFDSTAPDLVPADYDGQRTVFTLELPAFRQSGRRGFNP